MPSATRSATAWRTQSSFVRMRVRRRSGWLSAALMCWWSIRRAKGLDATARDAILKMQPPKVVYVSCDPATLARDVAELCGAGYTLEKAQAFDLFPRTFHVETIVLLQRGTL